MCHDRTETTTTGPERGRPVSSTARVRSLKNRDQPQQQPGMNKPEQDADVDDDGNQTKHDKWLQTIAETIENPETAAEKLPEIWRQATDPGGTWQTQLLREQAWNDAVETMFRNAETFPQHAKLAVALAGTPPCVWQATGWIITQARELLRQATPEQLLQALEYEQQHPQGWWQVRDHVLTWATLEQLTGPVIAQFEWNSNIVAWGTGPEMENSSFRARWQHISETIQQELLNGDTNAWAVFLGIVVPGNNIGDTAALAVAIEQQHRPVRTET